MSEKTDRVKEILVRNADGQIGNDTAALELEQLINEYVASATNRGFRNGYEAAEEQFEW
tara:strand:- start:313 stop:489 length:177 start_codon:yes stop_codon:yes gene_type:complete